MQVKIIPCFEYAVILSQPGIVNKQLNDKERVAAALENPALVKTVEDCLTGRV